MYLGLLIPQQYEWQTPPHQPNRRSKFYVVAFFHNYTITLATVSKGYRKKL